MVVLFIQHGFYLDRQAEQVDKALRIGLIVYVVFAERGDFFGIQRLRAGHTGVDDVAFIKL